MIFQICGLDGVTKESVCKADTVVSILNVYEPIPPEVERRAVRKLILRFNDTVHVRSNGPRREHVRELLAFAKGTTPSERLLIHCAAGISRSTAAAAVILAKLSATQDYDAIFKSIAEHRRYAWPNLRVIQLADKEMRAKGAFVRALERFYYEQTLDPAWSSASLWRPGELEENLGSKTGDRFFE